MFPERKLTEKEVHTHTHLYPSTLDKGIVQQMHWSPTVPPSGSIIFSSLLCAWRQPYLESSLLGALSLAWRKHKVSSRNKINSVGFLLHLPDRSQELEKWQGSVEENSIGCC